MVARCKFRPRFCSLRPAKNPLLFSSSLSIFLIIICFCPSVLAAVQPSDEQNIGHPVTISLEHALTPNNFTPRGQISFRNTNLFLLSNTNKISSSVQFSQSELSPSDAKNLQKLIANGNRYQIRVRVPNPKDPWGRPNYLVASIPACALQASNFADFIKLSLDQFGNVIGLDYRTANSDCSKVTPSTIGSGTLAHFDTKVRLGFGVEGSKVLRSEEVPEAVAKEKEANEKGFFAKYWMYLLPAVLLFMLGGLQAPQEPGQGGEPTAAGGGGGGATGAAAGSGAPAGGAASGGRRRRNK